MVRRKEERGDDIGYLFFSDFMDWYCFFFFSNISTKREKSVVKKNVMKSKTSKVY